jgi:hypothetical protein
VPSSSSSLNVSPYAIGLPSVSRWDRTARREHSLGWPMTVLRSSRRTEPVHGDGGRLCFLKVALCGSGAEDALRVVPCGLRRENRA